MKVNAMTTAAKPIFHLYDTAPLAIRAERASDVVARERLLDATFGDNRHARTCQRLRDGRKPAEGLAFTAVLDGPLSQIPGSPDSSQPSERTWNLSGTPANSKTACGFCFGNSHAFRCRCKGNFQNATRVIGTVRLWHVSAGGIPALMLGPLAVDASCRKLGAGAALMTRALDVARARGHGAVILLGDEAYYSRFGFSAGMTGNLALPGPFERERLLAVELGAGALEHASGLIVPTGALTPGARIHRARKILPPVSRAAKRTTTGALTSVRIVLPWNDDVERLQ